ncbi:MAG: fibronectin type III domain-containing protein, partial [Acidimicrobiales bacterium]
MSGVTVAAAANWAVGLTSATHPGQARSNTVNPPTGGSASSASSTSLLLSWNPPASGASPSAYTVTRNGAAVPSGSGCHGTVSATSCTDSGLVTNTTYTYAVVAVVGSNWKSAASSTFQGTTTNLVVVSLTTAGSHTLTIPANVTSFTFTLNGAGGGGGASGASGAAGGTVAGTITIPSSSSATVFTVIVGGAGGGASGVTGGGGGAGGTGCAPGGVGGSGTGSS